MKISDFKNEEALDLIVDILDPVGELFSDQEFVKAIQSGDKIKSIKIALKDHQRSIIEVLARLNGQTPDEYKGNIITMTKQMLEILNDRELSDFFTSQGLMEGEDASSDPMENTKAKKS